MAMRMLHGTFPREHRLQRAEYQPQVLAQAAILYIAKIQLNHFFEAQVAAAHYLPRTAAAGFYRQALHVVLAVQGNLARQAGARANEVHLAQEHVDELGQLVDAVLANEVTHTGNNARVVLHFKHGASGLVLGLQVLEHLVCVGNHAAELVDLKQVERAVFAHAAHAPL